MPGSPMHSRRKLAFDGTNVSAPKNIGSNSSSQNSTPEHLGVPILAVLHSKSVDYMDNEVECNIGKMSADKKLNKAAGWVSEPQLPSSKLRKDTEISHKSTNGLEEFQDNIQQASFYFEESLTLDKSVIPKKDSHTSMDEEFGRPKMAPLVKMTQMSIVGSKQKSKDMTFGSPNNINTVADYLAEISGGKPIAEVDTTSCDVGKIHKLDITTELRIDTSAPPKFEVLNESDINGNSSVPLSVKDVPVKTNGIRPISPASGNSDWQLYPNVDSMRSISVSLNTTHDSDMVEEEEKGLVIICTRQYLYINILYIYFFLQKNVSVALRS